MLCPTSRQGARCRSQRAAGLTREQCPPPTSYGPRVFHPQWEHPGGHSEASPLARRLLVPRACPLPRDRDSPGCHSSSLCASRAVQLPNSARLGNGEPASTAGQGRELRSTAARSLKRRALVPPSDRGYNGRENTSAPIPARARYWWQLFRTVRNPTPLTHPPGNGSALRLPQRILSCAGGIAAAHLPSATASGFNTFNTQPVTLISVPVL